MREPNFMMPKRSPRATCWPTVEPGHDAAREDADDLPATTTAAVVVEPDLGPLVVRARLVAVRGQELAGMILDAGDAAIDGRAVDVHVHRGQKDADLLPLPGGAPAPGGSPTIMTRPSAGETTRSGAVGTWRSGSRKKKTKNAGENDERNGPEPAEPPAERRAPRPAPRG